MRNLRLDLCYDGTRYRGWQRLPNTDNTIQGKLEQVLSRILEEPIEVTGSGRTDAGVHAYRQIANFHTNTTMPADEILENLRRYLPEDIGIYSCRDVSPRFHARLNAKQKTYCYSLWIGSSPCVFQRKYVTVFTKALDLDAMQKASSVLIGTHDFSAFCANRHMKKSTVRTIHSIRFEQQNSELKIYVTGNGFLHNMVRILIGTLIEVGQGSRSLESIPDLFGNTRENAGVLMPASGLCLMEVIY